MSCYTSQKSTVPLVLIPTTFIPSSDLFRHRHNCQIPPIFSTAVIAPVLVCVKLHMPHSKGNTKCNFVSHQQQWYSSTQREGTVTAGHWWYFSLSQQGEPFKVCGLLCFDEVRTSHPAFSMVNADIEQYLLISRQFAARQVKWNGVKNSLAACLRCWKTLYYLSSYLSAIHL